MSFRHVRSGTTQRTTGRTLRLVIGELLVAGMVGEQYCAALSIESIDLADLVAQSVQSALESREPRDKQERVAGDTVALGKA